MATSTRLGGGGAGSWRSHHQPSLLQRHRGHWRNNRIPKIRRPSSRKSFLLIIILACIAFLPAIFFHIKLRRLHQIQLKKCGWINDPPLVCAHGGDSINAFPNTMASYHLALRSKVDCIEIDVSRSKDGVLFALHDRELQRISSNSTSKVGHLSMGEIKELDVTNQSAQEFHDHTVPTIEDALKLVSNSIRLVILDAKVGPPSYEKGLAKDILAVVKRSQCKNCLIWSKSDTLVRDIIKLKSNLTVGYIVMVDPNTGFKTSLLRMKGAGVVGVYHPLIDEKLVRILQRRNKKTYAWTVDDADSMRKMLFEHVDAVVTSNPNLLQQLMNDIRAECLEEGFSLLGRNILPTRVS